MTIRIRVMRNNRSFSPWLTEDELKRLKYWKDIVAVEVKETMSAEDFEIRCRMDKHFKEMFSEPPLKITDHWNGKRYVK